MHICQRLHNSSRIFNRRWLRCGDTFLDMCRPGYRIETFWVFSKHHSYGVDPIHKNKSHFRDRQRSLYIWRVFGISQLRLHRSLVRMPPGCPALETFQTHPTETIWPGNALGQQKVLESVAGQIWNSLLSTVSRS